MANTETTPRNSTSDQIPEQQTNCSPTSPLSPLSSLPPSASATASPKKSHNSHRIPSSQTQLSLHSRLLSYLRVKRHNVCHMLLVPLSSLIILMLIASITFWYLKTFDTALQINHKHDELKGHCVPLRVPICQRHRVPYAYTIIPNFNGQTDQSEINHDLLDYEPIISVKCYSLLSLFLCSQMAPKCNSSGYMVPPCRSVCYEAQRRCNFFLAVFALQWPQDLDCDLLPDTSDPDICVGHQENQLLQRTAQFCDGNGFKCDASRCIPKSWQCDGFIDCQDSTDEKNCFNCSSAQFYCGNNVCIDKEDICDGIRDCPDGRDERQCLRLSKSMGHNGEGRLEAWNAENNIWQSVCGEDWDVTTMSSKACLTLGYQSINETRIRDETMSFGQFEAQSRVGNSLSINSRHTQMKILFDKGKRRCNNGKSLSVYLKCNNFECGKPAQYNSRKRRRRIVGGAESTPGQWPWLVAIHGGPEEIFFCGGVLISQWWILTAAHCIGNQTDTKGWVVNLGVTRRTASPFFVQKRHVSRLLKHPGFNPSANMYSSDIALILLSEPVEFDEFLRPVCLPPNPSWRLLPGIYCTVIGWGKSIHDDNADYLSTIHEVQVPIVSHKLCAEWYSEQDVPIPRTMLCAGYAEGKKDSCQGDSGGPLLCRDHDQSWFVAGVVSWGINCAQPHLPGIYTNVPMFFEWINAITYSEGHPLSSSYNYDY